MRWLFSFLLFSMLAVALALAGRYAPGYVVLVFPPWRVELSALTFLLLLAALLAGTLAFVRLATLTLRLPQQVREARARREREEQEALYQSAVTAWLEGRYQDAERAGERCSAGGSKLGLARVVAARAAHALRAFERRDAHLVVAKEYAPLAARYFDAEVRLDGSDVPGALSVVDQALALAPKHAALQALKLQALLKSGHWHEALRQVENLGRSRSLAPAQARQARLAALLGLLRQSGTGREALQEFWKNLPDVDQRDPLLARGGAEAFLAQGHPAFAARIVESALNKTWQEDLAHFYGAIVTDNLPRQIELAEAWLGAHPRDAGLLLSLARLCAAASLWGKAQSYLEASLALAPSVEGLLALAELEEKSGRSGAACGHLKRALELCSRAER